MARKASTGKVTLDRLDQKLDDVIYRLDKATAVMDQHILEDRKMYLQVDRLDQSEQRRKWHFRTLWGTMLATASAIGLVYFK